MPRPDWIEVGRVSRPHGVHGEVRITLESDNPDRFVPGSVLYGRPARQGVAGSGPRGRMQLTVAGVRGDDTFPIVAFDEIADRDAAEGLRDFVLEVQSGELPELAEDEFYPFDLTGLEVRRPQGELVGRVVDVVESPAHAILVVLLESGPEIMIPFIRAAVPTVAVDQGYLVIEPWFLDESGPAGMAGRPVEDGAEDCSGIDGAGKA